MYDTLLQVSQKKLISLFILYNLYNTETILCKDYTCV